MTDDKPHDDLFAEVLRLRDELDAAHQRIAADKDIIRTLKMEVMRLQRVNIALDVTHLEAIRELSAFISVHIFPIMNSVLSSLDKVEDQEKADKSRKYIRKLMAEMRDALVIPDIQEGDTTEK